MEKSLRIEEKELMLIKEFFLFVRDFYFDPTNASFRPKTIEEAIDFTLKKRVGSCSTKHYLLGNLLESHGFNVKYMTYPFYWQDLLLPYPDELRGLLSEMPIQYHLALKVLIKGEEKLIDATWDRPLIIAGFPVNEDNNLTEGMKLAINPCDSPIVHASAQERWNYIEELKQKIPKSDTVQSFYRMMKEWLNTIRSSFFLINNSSFPTIFDHDLSII